MSSVSLAIDTSVRRSFDLRAQRERNGSCSCAPAGNSTFDLAEGDAEESPAEVTEDGRHAEIISRLVFRPQRERSRNAALTNDTGDKREQHARAADDTAAERSRRRL